MAENENKNITQPSNSQENMPILDSYKDNPEQQKSKIRDPHGDGVEETTQKCPGNEVQKWNATGKGWEDLVAEVGKKATFKGQGATAGTLTASLIKRQECTITKMGVNQYEVSYVPKHCGQHELHIKEDGEHGSGSPFTVTVHKTYFPEKICGGFIAPQGIAVLTDGRIVVVEHTGHRFSIFENTNGVYYCERIGAKGSANGQFNQPCGVAVDDCGNILIADSKNNRMQTFSLQGECIKAVTDGKEHPINQPIGIGIHPRSKRIYITEELKCSIQILNPDLSPFKTFGKKGTGEGEFNDPIDVAFDSNGDVYVVDNENHRIQVFTESGEFKREFGNRKNQDSKSDKKLYYPTGICIDSDDIVYITELYNHCVSVYTHEGTFLTSFGSRGSDKGQFKFPRGIAVDKHGTIYVSDYGNDRVQIFKHQ